MLVVGDRKVRPRHSFVVVRYGCELNLGMNVLLVVGIVFDGGGSNGREGNS